MKINELEIICLFIFFFRIIKGKKIEIVRWLISIMKKENFISFLSPCPPPHWTTRAFLIFRRKISRREFCEPAVLLRLHPLHRPQLFMWIANTLSKRKMWRKCLVWIPKVFPSFSYSFPIFYEKKVPLTHEINWKNCIPFVFEGREE